MTSQKLKPDQQARESGLFFVQRKDKEKPVLYVVISTNVDMTTSSAENRNFENFWQFSSFT
jgi:hypothetical protein